MSKMKKIVSVIILGFCIIWVVYGLYVGKRLREDHKIGTGTVISTNKAGRGKHGPYLTYEYRIKEEFITAGNNWQEFEFSTSHYLVGRTFPVVYRKGLLGYDDYLLITPEDFKAYGYDFPDSLNWVLKYIKEDK